MENDVVIIGTGPAGSLSRRSMQARVIECAANAGASRRGHYDRLHLHTVKTWSAMPGRPFSRATPRYPSRQQMVDYQDAYARRSGTSADLGQQVLHVAAAADGGCSAVTASGKSCQACQAHHLVIATRANRVPHMPSCKGRQLFSGTVLDSRAYQGEIGVHAGPYFVGFGIRSPQGMLHRIALQAQQVAGVIHAQAQGRASGAAGALR